MSVKYMHMLKARSVSYDNSIPHATWNLTFDRQNVPFLIKERMPAYTEMLH